jgi:hypothetical protein
VVDWETNGLVRGKETSGIVKGIVRGNSEYAKGGGKTSAGGTNHRLME